ncbi:hypothetical protein GGF46_000748 [Coemansia sp. RSA 552]|nr:hypothetical protein GGF46_000748 [Coemansia sp. RSA 552]
MRGAAGRQQQSYMGLRLGAAQRAGGRRLLQCIVALALVVALLATPVLCAEPSEVAMDLVLHKDLDPAESSTASELESDDEDDDEGNIGIVGGFNGVSSFSPGSDASALTLNSSLTSLVSLSESAAQLLATGTAIGDITTACTLYGTDGKLSKAFFGGSISSLNRTTVGYVAGVDMAGNIDTMLGGVNGPVNALFCDNETQLVYVGGNFTSTTTGLTGSVATMRSESTGGLAIYEPSAHGWQSLSFHGVDGPVYDIAKLKNHVYAVGSFTATTDNATHSALDRQPINLSGSQLSGGNSAEMAGFSDPKNAVCTTGVDTPGNTWLMRDLLPGYLRVDFPFRVTPSLLRLMNTMYNGRGTKAIRIEAAPNNQALAMSYLDPATGVEKFCTQSCPLPHDYEWHEFRFVDDATTLANITGVIVNIVDWYGMGGGLSKIEVYQRDAGVYAIDDFNGSPCSQQAIRPTTQTTGSWQRTTAASYHGEYLTLNVAAGDAEAAAAATVSLVPLVAESGFYRVLMAIPGCQNTNTCAQRTSAKVTWLMNGKHSVVTKVRQHNLADEEVEVFSGYSPASTPEFSTAIYVGLADDVDPNAAAEVVVSSFRLERMTSFTNLNGVLSLNADPSEKDERDGPTYGPLDAGLPARSVVHAVVAGTTNDSDPSEVLFLGGQFADVDDGLYNLAQYRDGAVVPVGGYGLWGPCRALAFAGTSLFAGGSFNGTADFATELRNVGEYNTTDQKWYPLIGGTDGPVTSAVTYSPFGSRAVAFTGDFDSLFGGDPDAPTRIDADGLGMWDALAGGWTNTPLLQGGRPTLVFADTAKDGRDSVALAAGRFSAVAALEANGAVLLTPQQNIQAIDMMGFDLRPSDRGFAVNAGMWYARSNSSTPALVVGGRFLAPDGAANVARLDSGKWRGISDDVDVDGEVLSVAAAANLLFVGGIANSTGNFGGLAVVDMDRRRPVRLQPLLNGPDDHTGVRVTSVAVRADSSTVVVGGNFTSAGALPCQHLCTLDINESQWSPLPASTLQDHVRDLLFIRDRLLVAAAFRNGTESVRYLRAYDFGDGVWTDIPGVTDLPGPATVLASAPAAAEAEDAEETSADSFYVSGVSTTGLPYLRKFDGTSFVTPDFQLGPGSIVGGLLEVPRSRIPASVLGAESSLTRRSGTFSSRADTVPTGYVLAVSGDLYLPSGERASSAFFYNGQWAPFLSTVNNDGTPGFVSSIFFEIPPTNVFKRQRLSVALVIIIAIAIALGITFLIVLIGLVYIYLRNRREAAATASAASAALAATSGAAAGATAAKTPLHYRSITGPAAEPVSFDNIAPSTGRLNSGAAVGLAGLAAAGRHVPASSETYVQPQQSDAKRDLKYDDVNESLDSIFESAAAEAEAEAENEARERAISTGSIGAAVAAVSVAGRGTGNSDVKMPIPQHYNDAMPSRDVSASPDYSRSSIYRPDSTNPFEQRMALRESQGDDAAFPPAGPFGDDAGVGHVPMPSPHPEHATAAALAGATGAAALAVAGLPSKDHRRRSGSANTRNTEPDFSESLSSRPSGDSSVGGSSSATHLPIRDSLKQYPVFYAKFTFSSRETGELGFRAGERVFVIDQSDEIWWMGIVDHGSNQPLEQGVFPATYVSSDPPESTEWAELM